MTKKEATETRSSAAMMLMVIQSPCRLFFRAGETPETMGVCGDDGGAGETEGKELGLSVPMDGGREGYC